MVSDPRSKGSENDLGFGQTRDFLGANAEQLAQHIVVMLAELRGAATDPSGRLRQQIRRSNALAPSQDRVVDLLHLPARDDVWIGEQILRLEARRRRHAFG